MQLTFLGTSSGTPTKQRNVSACALQLAQSQNWSLIDCGEGTQHQLLHTPLSLAKLQTVFITHMHGDHCYGLPGLLASAAMNGRTAPLTIVGPAALEAYIYHVCQTTSLNLSFELEFVNVEQVRQWRTPDFLVDAVQLSHRLISFGYCFTEAHVPARLNVEKLKTDNIAKGPVWSQLQKGQTVTLSGSRVLRAEDYQLAPRKPRKIIIGGDNDTPALFTPHIDDTDVFVHESTYTQSVLDKVGSAPQHSSAKQVAEFAAQSDLKNLILTHFSPRYQDTSGDGSINDLEAEARHVYKNNLFLARDFDCFVLSAQGELKKI